MLRWLFVIVSCVRVMFLCRRHGRVTLAGPLGFAWPIRHSNNQHPILALPSAIMAAQGSNPTLDSVAIFKQRVTALGLGEVWGKFVEASWTSFGDFAFASSYQLGMVDDSHLKTKVIKRILGSEEHAKAPQVRR